MLIVGEKINATRKAVGAAIEQRNAEHIAKLAREQVEAGSDYLDANGGSPHPGAEPENMRWLVQTIQQTVDVPLCLDSADPKAIQAGLELVKHKPIINSISLEAQRLERAMERARRRVTALSADDGQVPTDAPRAPFPRLPVETRRGVVLLDPDHITHAVIDGVSCLLHTDDQHYVTDFRLSDLERRLPADRFMRLHRQALVNLLRVERLEPTESGGYRAILDTGATVAVSRGAARRLRQWWEAR